MPDRRFWAHVLLVQPVARSAGDRGVALEEREHRNHILSLSARRAAARFSRSGNDPGWIDVTYDASTCVVAQKAIIVYGDLGNFSTYQECAQSDAGNSRTTSFEASTLSDVWFNIVWTEGTTAGHPSYGSSATTDVARSWSAAGFCGVTADDHGHETCP